jgi:hypothetical protein
MRSLQKPVRLPRARQVVGDPPGDVRPAKHLCNALRRCVTISGGRYTGSLANQGLAFVGMVEAAGIERASAGSAGASQRLINNNFSNVS